MFNNRRKSFHPGFVYFSCLTQKVVSILDKGTGEDLLDLLGFKRRIKELNINFVQVLLLELLRFYLNTHVRRQGQLDFRYWVLNPLVPKNLGHIKVTFIVSDDHVVQLHYKLHRFSELQLT